MVCAAPVLLVAACFGRDVALGCVWHRRPRVRHRCARNVLRHQTGRRVCRNVETLVSCVLVIIPNTSAVSSTDLLVYSQLCKLRDLSAARVLYSTRML